MELEVSDKEFYVLTMKKDGKITLHNEMNSPIKKIRDYLKEGTDPDDIELIIIEIKEDKYEMKSVPWSDIASGLVKLGST